MTDCVEIGAAFIGTSKQHLSVRELCDWGLTRFHFDIIVGKSGQLVIRDAKYSLKSLLPHLMILKSLSHVWVYLSMEPDDVFAVNNYLADMRLRSEKLRFVLLNRPVHTAKGVKNFRDHVIQLYSNRALDIKGARSPACCIWTYKRRYLFLSQKMQSKMYNKKFKKVASDYASLVSELDCVLMYHIS